MKPVWRGIVFLAAVISCAACDEREPPVRAYVQWGDRFKAATGGLFGSPCFTKIEQNGSITYSGRLDDTCYRFEQSKRFRGTWRNEFEGSRFCSVLDTQCDVNDRRRASETWLDVERAYPALIEDKRTGIYEIDFIGRKTMFKGGYGHMGLSDHSIIVDRIISLKKVSDLKEE